MLLADRGQQLHRLHDVVDGRQDEHRQDSLRVVAARQVIPLLGGDEEALLPPHVGGDLVVTREQPSVDEQGMKGGPLGVLVEGLPLRPLLLGLQAAVGRALPGLPRLVEAVAEGLTPVQGQAHEPEEGEHGSQGALVLVLASPAAGHVAHEVQVQLGERRGDVPVEVLAGVARAADLPGRAPGPLHVHLLPPHQVLEDGGAAAEGEPGPARAGSGPALHVSVRLGHQQEPPLLAHLRPPRLGVPPRQGRGALDPGRRGVAAALPGPVHDGHAASARALGGLPPGEGEVLAVREADAVQGRGVHLVHDHPGGDLVDLVQGLDPRVRARDSTVLPRLVRGKVHSDAAELGLWRDSQTLVEQRLHGLLPGLPLGQPHRQWAAFVRLVALPPLDLGVQQEHLVGSEDVRMQPDFEDAHLATQLAVLCQLQRRLAGVVDFVVEL
mmetsp:Transcript_19982/g.53549  ORF Transcript_19982/g.53549 Transcript_19982/m.53549 type:complete len:439 (+) Transcript_19982:1162-2478(+)